MKYLKITSLTVFAAFLLTMPAAYGQQRTISTAKEPSWITPHTVNLAVTGLEQEAGEGKLDLDFEQQVDIASQSTYIRHTLKLLSEAGVQNASEVSVNFDPSYQTLQFHSIKIIREGRPINQLDLSKIRTVHQEKELDRFIYNNTRTAVLFLEDVRKGDIIEYSYTLKGFNPIKKKYSDEFDFQFGAPVAQLYYKVIVPNGRSIKIKNSHSSVEPVITKDKNASVYEWSAEKVGPLNLQDNTPGWFDPFPKVSLSEYQSWKEVNDWALQLFDTPASLSPALKDKIQAIKTTYASAEARTMAALQFVQDDIRYLGIEMGENTQKPHRPDQIFAQRFGDCKDKSFLLCTMLHELGVEAHPVLINTTTKASLANELPAADAFDHCTVQAVVNHTIYWFDPTISFQRGPIQSIYYPDYQAGLVIAPQTTGLTTIPFHSKGKESVSEVFQVPDMSGMAHLVVTTQFSGSYADDNREYFKNTSQADIKKGFTDFYGAYFSKIGIDTVTYIDDERTGTLTTVEKYTITDFWGNLNSIQKVSFEPYVINSNIKRPKEQESRTMPYSLYYPARFDETIEVDLPHYWHISESNHEVKGSHFLYTANYECNGRKVLLKYHYENVKDHVESTEMKDYLARLDKMDEFQAYELSSNTVGEDSSSALSMPGGNFIYLYLLLGLCVFITYKVRQRNS